MSVARPEAPSRTVAVLLTCLVAIGPVSTDLYLASLPDMARALATEPARAQLTLSAFLMGFAASQLVYGPLSDRFGRRPVILAGMMVYIAASLFCMAAPTIDALIAGRFVQAVGACCGPVVGRAVVRDVYPRDQAARVMSFMASAMALAPFAAPVAGGWLHALFGWRANFGVMLVFGLGLAVAVRRLLAETNLHPDHDALAPSRLVANYGRLLGDRSYLGSVLTVAFSFAGMFAFITASSFVLIETLGLPTQWFGLGFAVVIAGYVSGAYLAGLLTARVGLQRMVRVGLGLGMVGGLVGTGLALAGVQSFAAVLLPLSLYFFSAALVLPNCTAAAVAPFPRMAGSASAGIGFVQMLAGAAAGWGVAHTFDGTTRPLALSVLACALGALASYVLLVRNHGDD